MARHSPRSASSAAVRSRSSALREATTTRTPASSRPPAIIRPMPREPPVTSAFLPATSKRSVGKLGLALLQKGADRLGHGTAEGAHDLLTVLVFDRRPLCGDLQRAPHPALGQPHSP